MGLCVQCAELHLSLCLNLYPPYPHASFSVWINQVWMPVTKLTSTTDIPTVYTAIPFQVSSFLRGLLLCLICLSWTFPFKIMPSLTVASCLFWEMTNNWTTHANIKLFKTTQPHPHLNIYLEVATGQQDYVSIVVRVEYIRISKVYINYPVKGL